MSVDGDYSSDDDGDMQRLYMLKQLWYDTKVELEGAPYSTSLHRRLRPSILGPSASTSSFYAAPGYGSSSFSLSSSSSSNGLGIGGNGTGSGSMGLKKRGDSIDPSVLQVVMKQALERHGGSIQLDVLIKYVQERWPTLRRRGGALLYSAADLKKYVLNCLRLYKPCKDMFAKDPQRDNCLVFLTERIDWVDHLKAGSRIDRRSANSARPAPARRKEPIAQLIAKFLQGKVEGVDLEEIEPYILLNWAVPCPGGVPLEVAEIRETIRTALDHDPIFHCISEEPFIYTLASTMAKSSNKRSRAPSDYDASGIDASGLSGYGGDASSDRGSDRMSSSGSSSSSSSSSSSGSSSSSSSAAAAKRMRNMSRRNNTNNNGGAAGHDSEHDELASEDERGTWICCDSCNSWVKAEDDGITDISIYDDNNPNHLEYNCPACRSKSRSGRSVARTASSRPTAKRDAASREAVAKESSSSRSKAATPTSSRRSSSSSSSSSSRQHASESSRQRQRTASFSSTRTARSSANSAAASSKDDSSSSDDDDDDDDDDNDNNNDDDVNNDNDNDDDLSDADGDVDRLDQLYQELVQAHSFDRRTQEDVRRQKESLADSRARQWRKNREQAHDKLKKIKAAHRANLQRIEDDLMKQLREQFHKLS